MKIFNIRLIISAGEAKAGAVLNPILGQNQINVLKFCTEFNTITDNFNKGVFVRVKLSNDSGNLKIDVGSPPAREILHQIWLARFGEEFPGLGGIAAISKIYSALQDTVLILKQFYPRKSEQRLLKQLLSSCRT